MPLELGEKTSLVAMREKNSKDVARSLLLAVVSATPDYVFYNTGGVENATTEFE